MKVLVVAAHPDDEVLGCGGTVARHTAAGDEVRVAFLAQGAMARPGATPAQVDALRESARKANKILGVGEVAFGELPDNKLDTVDRLGITQVIESQLAQWHADIVYTHHWADLNVDHRRVNECVMTACRPLPGASVTRVLFFEVPSSTEWRGPQASFTPNWFVDISKTLDRKIEAMRCYASEMRAFPHPRSEEALRALARWRGATAGVEAAEAFVLGRMIEAY